MDDDNGSLLAIPGIILILGAIILIIGFCVSSEAKRKMTPDQQIEQTHSLTKIEYEGHSYIIMTNSKYQNGICHDENCKCKITK